MLIKDMNINQSVKCTLVVVEGAIKMAKNGPYLHLILADKEQNQIEGKLWQYSEGGEFPSGLVLDIEGVINEYNGKKDINIKSIVHNETVPSEDFLGYDKEKVSKIYNSLLDRAYNLNNWSLREVTVYILTNYADEICKGVGAKSVHHNFVGGYLQHIYEVVLAVENLSNVCDVMEVPYDHDLLIAGAILHDLGKLEAYKVEGLKIDESTQGQLIDHMALSILMIDNAYNSTVMEKDETYYKLLHIIQSHHGCKEWGSPVPPKTVEAQVIHFADNFSAKLDIMKNELEKCNSEWTEKCWSLGGIRLYKGLSKDID